MVLNLTVIAVLLALSGSAVVLGRSRRAGAFIYGGCLLAALAGLVSPFAHLYGGAPDSLSTLPLGLPWLGAHFALDGLSAFFLLIVNGGSAMASLYALGYGRHERAPERIVPFYPAFLAGMNLVALAADAFTFLLSWEVMSLVSWALVMAHHRVRDNVHAGYVYIVMASFGTFALLLAFGMLAGPDGVYDFTAMRAGTHAAWQEAAIVALVLLGAGSKAGLVPLHVWLPLAHPAAPSHVSALMSGVMTKVAIYGFIRIVFDLLGGTGWQAALVILLLGGASAVIGVLQALMHSDIKKILACSTVENVGIVFIGLGLALAFRAAGLSVPATVALCAALLHVFNHMLFKSLLFFGAGAVLTATGVRELDRLGGLIHRMPATAVCVLIGCAAIAALPPLNGFVSEWLLFQTILQSPALPQWGVRAAIPAAGCLLALAAALAGACFVRFFGIAFLGRPRSSAAGGASETDRFSLTAMALLAGICVVAGIAPGLILAGVENAAQGLAGGASSAFRTGADGFAIEPFSRDQSTYNGLLVFAFVVVASAVTALAARWLASSALRRGPAWDCGFPESSSQTQYGAGSFAQPVRRVFCTHLFRAREQVTMPAPGDLAPAVFHLRLIDPVWDGLYAPLAAAVQKAAFRLNGLQFLTIRRYLGIAFLFLVFLLTVLTLWT